MCGRIKAYLHTDFRHFFIRMLQELFGLFKPSAQNIFRQVFARCLFIGPGKVNGVQIHLPGQRIDRKILRDMPGDKSIESPVYGTGPVLCLG